jgi:hypothetical protein
MVQQGFGGTKVHLLDRESQTIRRHSTNNAGKGIQA